MPPYTLLKDLFTDLIVAIARNEKLSQEPLIELLKAVMGMTLSPPNSSEKNFPLACSNLKSAEQVFLSFCSDNAAITPIAEEVIAKRARIISVTASLSDHLRSQQIQGGASQKPLLRRMVFTSSPLASKVINAQDLTSDRNVNSSTSHLSID